MKMVKSLLLGTAAGLVAVAGAQAADMPVKAAPVQYVKICSLYGDGFYYIPGTDTCLKMGGYLRVQAEYNMGGGGVAARRQRRRMAAQGRFTRDLTNDINYRVRGAISWDVRQQTEYGTLRTYIRFGAENTTPAATGGGTTTRSGIARSSSLRASRSAGRSRSSTSSPTAAPTATTTCGPPVTPAPPARTCGPTPPSSATASPARSRWKTPQPARRGTLDVTAAGFFEPGAALVNDNALRDQLAPTLNGFGFRVPDIIANLRVDQAWGFAGISAASARRQRRLLRRTPQRGQQRPSRRQVWLGDGGRRQVQPAGRRHDRLQRLLQRRRGRLLHQPQLRSSSTTPAAAWAWAGSPTASSPPAPRSS